MEGKIRVKRVRKEHLAADNGLLPDHHVRPSAMSRHPPEPAPPYSASPTTSVITTSFSLRQNRRRMAEVVFQAAGESDKFVGLTSRIGSHRENFPLNGGAFPRPPSACSGSKSGG